MGCVLVTGSWSSPTSVFALYCWGWESGNDTAWLPASSLPARFPPRPPLLVGASGEEGESPCFWVLLWGSCRRGWATWGSSSSDRWPLSRFQDRRTHLACCAETVGLRDCHTSPLAVLPSSSVLLPLLCLCSPTSLPTFVTSSLVSVHGLFQQQI